MQIECDDLANHFETLLSGEGRRFIVLSVLREEFVRWSVPLSWIELGGSTELVNLVVNATYEQGIRELSSCQIKPELQSDIKYEALLYNEQNM